MSETNENVVPGSPEYDNQMAQLADSSVNQQAPQSVETAGKPEAVPDKFWDAEKGVVNFEAWAKSTNELESALTKQSQPNEGEQSTEGTPELPEGSTLTSDAFTKYSQEFAVTGELSEATYGELEKSGVPREYVDAYIAGQQAMASQAEAQLLSDAGFATRADFDKATEWAKSNLSEDLIAQHNAATASGDPARIALALSKLAQSYSGAKGTQSSSLLEGNGASQESGGFASTYEMQQAMADPRYSKDPAYRQQVMNKVIASNF